jgi:hypothetical protein
MVGEELPSKAAMGNADVVIQRVSGSRFLPGTKFGKITANIVLQNIRSGNGG